MRNEPFAPPLPTSMREWHSKSEARKTLIEIKMLCFRRLKIFIKLPE